MSIELKIKSKHLAVESKIIRKEELKLKNGNEKLKNFIAKNPDIPQEKIEKWKRQAASRSSKVVTLASHRTSVLRKAARSTNLAYGFLRGVPYRAMECAGTKTQPNWDAVEKMVIKYSGQDSRTSKQRFAEWSDEKYNIT